MNARLLADEWKVGTNLREQRREDGIVSRATISSAVTKLMDFGDDSSPSIKATIELWIYGQSTQCCAPAEKPRIHVLINLYPAIYVC